MKKALLLLPALFLVACQDSAPDVPQQLDTQAALKMHEPRQLVSDLMGKLTWTSSHPDVVAVDQAGNVTGLRLTAEPVTITVSSGSRTQTAELTTYGLELSMCTFNDNILMKNTGKLRLCALTKFRTEKGAIAPNPAEEMNSYPVEITDPNGNIVDLRSSIFPTETGQDAWVRYNTKLFPEAGTYQASVEIAGEKYVAAAVLDPDAKAEGIVNADMNLTQDTYQITGEFGEGTGAVWPWCYRMADRKRSYVGQIKTELPVSENHDFDVAGSRVRCDFVSYTVNPLDFSVITPPQVNMAWQQGKVFDFEN